MLPKLVHTMNPKNFTETLGKSFFSSAFEITVFILQSHVGWERKKHTEDV